jgi:hypothetical protein
MTWKRWRTLLCVSGWVLGLTLLATERVQAAGPCGACQPSQSCDTVCHTEDDEWMTCGGYGAECQDECRWQEVSRTQIGANDGGVGPLCTYWVTFLSTEVNTCTNEQRQLCDHHFDGMGWGSCCPPWGCWGADSC